MPTNNSIGMQQEWTPQILPSFKLSFSIRHYLNLASTLRSHDFRLVRTRTIRKGLIAQANYSRNSNTKLIQSENKSKMTNKKLFVPFLFFVVLNSSWLTTTDGYRPLDIFFDEKTLETRRAHELEKERKIKISNRNRSAANAIIFCNTGLLLKGGNAFPTFVSSIIAAKAIHDTNDVNSVDDSGTLKVYVSLIFSGTAALNRWLMRRTQPAEWEEDNLREGKDTTREQASLLFWSRGMELVGGFILLFINFIML